MTTQPLDRVVPAPDDVARYETDADAARQILRLEPAVLDDLVARGFPHRRAPDGRALFDYIDLANAALVSGSGESIPELARRFLLRFISASPESWYEPRAWEVAVRSPVPPPGVELEAVEVAPPDGDAAGVELLSLDAAPEGIGYVARVRLRGERAEIEAPAAAAAWDEVAGALVDGSVSYQTVGETLRADHHRAWRLGMADCAVASRVLADRLRERGFEARVRRGFLLGLLGSDHTWCELREGGRWKVLDPAFARIGAESARDDFAAACAGGRFNRLLPCAGDGGPVVTLADGSPAPLWYLGGVSARPLRTA